MQQCNKKRKNHPFKAHVGYVASHVLCSTNKELYQTFLSKTFLFIRSRKLQSRRSIFKAFSPHRQYLDLRLGKQHPDTSN